MEFGILIQTNFITDRREHGQDNQKHYTRLNTSVIEILSMLRKQAPAAAKKYLHAGKTL